MRLRARCRTHEKMISRCRASRGTARMPIWQPMGDIFEDIFAQNPVDPTEAARRAAGRRLRQRFYEAATVGEGFLVLLDGKPARTPARRPLAAPSRALVQALAEEWQAQATTVDPRTMPLTRLANSILDGVVGAHEQVAAEVEKYLGSDLLFYRAQHPERLAARQRAHWDPILVWARQTLGAAFEPVEGITYVDQPKTAIGAAAAAIPHDPWRLGALHAITTLTGSALIALALAADAVGVETAWAAAHVDEDWNMELWGRDELAVERHAYRFSEMRAAAMVLAFVR